jgi:hypothetical protein
MNKIVWIISLALTLVSCCSEPKKNKERIENIDSMSGLTTVYIVELNSSQNFKDTLSIEKYKKCKGNKVYEEKRYFSGKNTLTIASYFSNDGELFFESSKHSSLGLVFEYEYWNQEDEIERAISVSYENNRVQDTIFIEYDNSQRATNNKTIINSKYEGKISNQIELIYNQNDLIVSEVFIMENDTLSVTGYKYNEKKLIEKKVNNYSDSILTKTKYVNERPIEKKIYGMGNKLRSYKYQYKRNGEINKTTIASYPSNKKTVLMHIAQ